MNSVRNVVSTITTMMKQHGKPGLVVIDTLNQNFGAGDENSTADMTRFMTTLNIEVRAKLGCSVLIVHHTNLTDTSRSRGSGALHNGIDWEYKMARDSDGLCTLTFIKHKDFEKPDPMCFEYDVVELPWIDEDGEPLTSCILRQVETPPGEKKKEKLTPQSSIALDALRKLINAKKAKDESLDLNNIRIPIEDWREKAHKMGLTNSSTESGRRMAFKRALDNLIMCGRITVTDDFCSINS